MADAFCISAAPRWPLLQGLLEQLRSTIPAGLGWP